MSVQVTIVLCEKCCKEIFAGDIIDSNGDHRLCDDPVLLNHKRILSGNRFGYVSDEGREVWL